MKYAYSIFLSAILVFHTVHAQTTYTPASGDYLGQKKPGMQPEIFAPGLISTKYYEHGAPAFSPDGNTVLWTVIYERGKPSRIMEMRRENNIWTKPALVAFADTTVDDLYPSFSADGKKLYFSSRRKLPAGYPPTPGAIRIWEVEKNTKGWGEPLLMDTTYFKTELYYHSVTNSGTIYASSRSQGGRVFDIVSYKKNHQPETLPYNINSRWSEDGVFISPDESYLIFESARPGGIENSTDLYISFKRNDDTWSVAMNMGPAVNSKFTERFARVSPDGKYLFLGSDRNLVPGAEGTDIYWVDAKVIEELRKHSLKETAIGQEGKDLLQSLYGNDHAKATRLLKVWLTQHPKDVNGYIDLFSLLRRNRQYAEAEKEMNAMDKNLPDDADLKTELVLIKYAQDKNEEAEKLMAAFPAQTITQRNRYTTIASELYSIKKYKESASMYEVALKIQPRAVDFYNAACSYALGGDKAHAFDALHKAADNGYREKERIEADNDLESLQSDARWSELQKKFTSVLPPEDPGKPYKRAHHEMIYDEAAKSVLMISGSTPLNRGEYAIFFNDIWRYDQSGWHKIGLAGDKRSGIRLAYDSRRNKVYSFGGFTGDNQSSGQLRVLENNQWKILSDIPEMKAAEPGFVYDSDRDKLIAFAGSAGRGQVNNVTWEWDGVTWKKIEGNGPKGRQAFAMVYDSKRKRTIVYGGLETNDLWEFDGKEWKNIQAEVMPEPRSAFGFTYDSKAGLLIIFGGVGTNGFKADTWGWNGKEWKKLADTGPANRVMGYMAYDKNRDRTILFGGRLGWLNDTDDTWEWDGKAWREVK